MRNWRRKRGGEPDAQVSNPMGSDSSAVAYFRVNLSYGASSAESHRERYFLCYQQTFRSSEFERGRYKKGISGSPKHLSVARSFWYLLYLLFSLI